MYICYWILWMFILFDNKLNSNETAPATISEDAVWCLKISNQTDITF